MRWTYTRGRGLWMPQAATGSLPSAAPPAPSWVLPDPPDQLDPGWYNSGASSTVLGTTIEGNDAVEVSSGGATWNRRGLNSPDTDYIPGTDYTYRFVIRKGTSTSFTTYVHGSNRVVWDAAGTPSVSNQISGNGTFSNFNVTGLGADTYEITFDWANTDLSSQPVQVGIGPNSTTVGETVIFSFANVALL